MSLASPSIRPLSALRSARLSPVSVAPCLALLIVLAIAAGSPTTLNDGDSWWHVRAGEWMLAHRAVPSIDVFSYTMAGRPWTAHEWLSEVLLALAFAAGGWSGVVLLAGAAAGLAAFVLTTRLGRVLEGPALALVVLLALSLMAPGLLARPHLLALPVMVIWSGALLDARAAGRAPSLLFLPLMTLWANLHGGFALGLALTAAFALEALLAAPALARRAVVFGWGRFGLLAGAAALLTPHGVEGLLFPVKLIGMQSLAMIGEWKPSDFSRPGPLEIALMALLALAMTRPVRVKPFRLALLLGLLHLALSHVRHKMVLGAIAPMLLAEPIATALGQGRRAGVHGDLEQGAGRGWRAWPLIATAMLALAIGALRIAVPVQRGDGPAAPIAALAALPDRLRAEPVFNAYDFGGYLIWSGIKPFIDGRTDMYGDAMMAEQASIVAAKPGSLEQGLERHRFSWTILHPSDPLAGVLDRDPHWRRLYADPFAVIHERLG